MKRTTVPQSTAIRAASCLAAVVLTASVTSHASAALAGYEGFAGYTPEADITGQTGTGNFGFEATGWAGNDGVGASTGKKAVATGLTYTNGGTLQTSEGALMSNGGFNRGHRGITTPIDPGVPGGGSLWISYLFKSGPSTEDANQVRFYTSGTNFDGQTISADVTRYWNPNAGDPNHLKNQVKSRLWFSEGTAGGIAQFKPAGETNLILMEYMLDDSDMAGNQGLARMYVNPVIGGAAPDPSTAVTSQEAGDFDPMTRLSLFSPGGGDHAVTWDEIRWGSTFAAVTPVPEPATIGSILSLAGLALARRRH